MKQHSRFKIQHFEHYTTIHENLASSGQSYLNLYTFFYFMKMGVGRLHRYKSLKLNITHLLKTNLNKLTDQLLFTCLRPDSFEIPTDIPSCIYFKRGFHLKASREMRFLLRKTHLHQHYIIIANLVSLIR